MICVTLLLFMHAMYSGGVVCAFCGSCMVGVLINLSTSVKSEYVSFPTASFYQSYCPGVGGLCTCWLDWGVCLLWELQYVCILL